jgi:hypothetical protein
VTPRALRWLLPLALVALAAAIVAAPLGMAMGVVLVCAGPHNWCEARYFLSRMPGRWGAWRPGMLAGLGGVGLLTLAFIAMSVWPLLWPDASAETSLVLLALWETALVIWVVALFGLRERTVRGRADAAHAVATVVPVAALCIAAAWLWPLWVSVALVFAHTLVSLAFMDRELAVRRVAWRPAWRGTVALLPLVVLGVWWGAAVVVDAAPLAGTPEAAQAGAFLLPDAVAPALIATHVLLETVHYAVWIVGIPLTTSAAPWHLRGVPLAVPSRGWRGWLAAGLAAGALAVLLLWILFAIDYAWTRQVYFTVAVAHVLAEVPFLVLLRR